MQQSISKRLKVSLFKRFVRHFR